MSTTDTSAANPRTLPDPGAVRSPERLAHIVFRTNDLPAMRDWYCSVLGAHPVFGDERILFLTYDDEHHRVALIAHGPYPDPAEDVRAGFYHSAFTYPDLGVLLATFRRLRSAGIEPVRCIKHEPTVSLYYRDPDGNHVELQVDAFSTADAATEWMKGAVFAANPIGTAFDPEVMIADYERGMPHDELVHRDDDPAATIRGDHP